MVYCTGQPLLRNLAILSFLRRNAQQDLQLPIEVDNVLHAEPLMELFKLLIAHPHKSFANSQLASVFNLSITELRDSFLRHFSVSLNGFIRMTKMMMVFELLTEKNISLSAIANTAGYSNWQTLNKAFFKYYGCELEELRRAM